MDVLPERFSVDIPETILADLRARIERARWPDEVDGAGWEYGTNLAYMRELIEYWRDRFDWRAQEAAINAFHHFQVRLDSHTVHFIHERGKGPNPLPIVLTHGWPSTFFEMHKLIPLLADPESHGGDPADAFDLVVPSLPGYGFSSRPAARGFTIPRIADLWARLMTDVLGYSRFAAHGGDIGAGITTQLARRHPERLTGIHLTAVTDPYLGPGSRELSAEERTFQAVRAEWDDEEDGYGHIQRTRPQTLAYGLNDSPTALAAWIVEKYRAWSDCGGDIEQRFSKDELLTNITIYWATETINSSIRLYFEARHHPTPLALGERITPPCGVTLTREAVDRAPREWAERSYDVRYWSELPRGGHFAALEEPQLLAGEIRAFFRQFREL